MKTKQLPMGWKEVELGEIFEYQPKTGRKAGEGLKEGDNKFFTSSTKQTKSINDFDFDGEYLIFPTGGQAGIHYCNERFSSSNDCLVVLIKGVLTKYVYYYLRAKLYLLEEGFKGAGLEHISKNYINKIKIPLPPLPTQKKIVQILEQAEKLKQQREKANRLMDDYLKSVFNEMFFNEDFEMEDLNEICNKIIDIEHKMPKKVEKGIPFLSAKDIVNGEIDFRKVKYISEEDHIRLNSRCNPEKGDLLYSRIGTIGIARKINTEKKFTISYSLILIKPVFDKVDNIYLEHALNSNFVFSQAKQHTRGIGVPDLNMGEIKSFKIPLPPLPLQKKFANIVEKVERIKEKQKQSKEELDNLFSALMQKAFRGELV